MKLLGLQAVTILGYLLIRLSKLWTFQTFFQNDNYHDLNFWLGIGVFVVAIFIQTVLLAQIVLRWIFEYYEVKEDYIVHTRGVLKKKEDIYSLRTIEAGNVIQPLFGKLLNYGTIRIYSPVLKTEYFLHDIPNPREMRDTLTSLLSSEKTGNEKIIPREA